MIKIGRRVPRNWFKRSAHKVRGLMTFQENMWLIIDRSIRMAKKKCTQTPNGGNFTKQTFREPEDLNYDIEWIEVIYTGNPDQEEEEYQEALQMYKEFGSLFKDEMPKDETFSKPFKTKRLTQEKIDKIYKKGYDASTDKSISQKLLDLGILTHVEKFDPESKFV